MAMWGGALISTVLGTEYPGPGTIYLGQNLRFLKPVHIGDSIDVRLTVAQKDEHKHHITFDCRCTNQNGEDVITGSAFVLAPTEKVRRVRMAPMQVRLSDRTLQHRQLLALVKELPPITVAVVHPCSEEALQGACFDTAFHATQPAVAQACALPREITQAGVRRYGFHGLSYEYIATQLPHVVGLKAGGRVVVAHLGNGASLCAMVDGKSVASTMGFSALEGLVMGTRCGSLDPGVVLYLLQALHMSPQAVSDLLYRQSGLLGVSGISHDMQVLLASGHPHAAQAIDLFVYRIVREIGGLAAAMGGLDALVFTAGIGEHAAPIRQKICQGCSWLGARIDPAANAANLAASKALGQSRDPGAAKGSSAANPPGAVKHPGAAKAPKQIHLPESALQLFVIPTDEEQMLALHAAQAVFGA
ncbi:MAG: acetate kinase [Limnobacter sp.]|nr:acetate kinase [Limnobacter sp.]